MGMFVNPDNSAFQVALNSEIYVDKTGIIKYTNRVLNTLQGIFATAVLEDWKVYYSEYAHSLLQQGLRFRSNSSLIWKSARTQILRSI